MYVVLFIHSYLYFQYMAHYSRILEDPQAFSSPLHHPSPVAEVGAFGAHQHCPEAETARLPAPLCLSEPQNGRGPSGAPFCPKKKRLRSPKSSNFVRISKLDHREYSGVLCELKAAKGPRKEQGGRRLRIRGIFISLRALNSSLPLSHFSNLLLPCRKLCCLLCVPPLSLPKRQRH